MGFGGHGEKIIEKLNNKGKYIGIDQDINAINYCKEKFLNYKTLVCTKNYSHFKIFFNMKI